MTKEFQLCLRKKRKKEIGLKLTKSETYEVEYVA